MHTIDPTVRPATQMGGPRRGTPGLVVAEWRRIGGLGQMALVGLVASVALTVVMGFTIIGSVRSHLVEARSELVAKAVDDLPPIGPDDAPGTQEFAAFASAVQRRILGGEVQRVKVWLDGGLIIYSDDSTLIGRTFPLTEPAVEAFDGVVVSHISDLSDPAHEGDRDEGRLLETYVPRGDERVESVVEVEQRLDSLYEVMSDVTLNVWLAIGLGVGVLGVVLGALGVGVARTLDRRRIQAEFLLDRAFEARDDERRKVAGVLHDDVGQALYRLNYGIEGSVAQLPVDHPVQAELRRMGGIVREVDVALRAELDHLHRGLVEDAGLEASLRDLVATTVAETDLSVSLDIGSIGVLPPDGDTAIFRAAQEAVVNVRKHAAASEVAIGVEAVPGGTRLTVRDDGIGIGVERGLGLSTTRARLERLGGTLVVEAADGGTVLTAWVPDGVEAG